MNRWIFWRIKTMEFKNREVGFYNFVKYLIFFRLQFKSDETFFVLRFSKLSWRNTICYGNTCWNDESMRTMTLNQKPLPFHLAKKRWKLSTINHWYWLQTHRWEKTCSQVFYRFARRSIGKVLYADYLNAINRTLQSKKVRRKRRFWTKIGVSMNGLETRRRILPSLERNIHRHLRTKVEK